MYLTDRQREVVAAIKRLSAQGYSPTIRELGRELGIPNPNGVKAHLFALRRKGAITWNERQPRTVRVVK